MVARIILQPLYTPDAGPPPSLETAEIAFSEADKGLYIGLSDDSIYQFPFLSLAEVLTSDREYSTIINRPTTLNGLGVTLAVADLPAGYDYQSLNNRPDISALDELEDYPNLASFPAVGEAGKLYIDLSTGLFYRWTTSQYSQLTGKAAIWGEIVGTVDDQADLKARLDSLQTQIDGLVTLVENSRIKVGDLYFSTDAANPAVKLGYGTWTAHGKGRVLVGRDDADPTFATVGATGGSKTHTLTVAEMPTHKHDIVGFSAGGSSSIYAPQWVGAASLGQGISTDAIQNQGSGQPHNNLPPYQVIYCWLRTA